MLRFSGKKVLKSAIAVFCLLIAATFFVYSPGRHDGPVNIKDRDYDNFTADKINIRHSGADSNILFNLSADKAIHRKIRSRLFVYQNLKEIYISGTTIDFYCSSTGHGDPDKIGAPSENGLNKIHIPVNDMGRVILSLARPSTSADEFIAGHAGADMDLLIRILFGKLSVNIHCVSGNKVSINASRARANVDSGNIIFEENVRIVASDGNTIKTTRAVWSNRFSGLLLPEGYNALKGSRNERAFFVIDPDGKFSRALNVPKIVYEDPLEEKESIFYTRVFEKMPAHVKLMAGFP